MGNNKSVMLLMLIIGILIENSLECKQFGEACDPFTPMDCCFGNLCSKTNLTDANSWKCIVDERCTQPHDECGNLKPPCCTGYECISSKCKLKGQESSSECKSMGDVCKPKDKDCCDGLTCGLTTNDPNSWKCIIKTCQGLDENCGLGSRSCCSGYQCTTVSGFVAKCQLKKEEKKETKDDQQCLGEKRSCKNKGEDCCNGLRCIQTREDIDSWHCKKASCVDRFLAPCGLLHPCCDPYKCVFQFPNFFQGKCGSNIKSSKAH